MAAAVTRPRVSTVIKTLGLPQNGGVNDRITVSAKERDAFKKLAIKAEDFKGKDTVDIQSLVRVLTLLQDNVSDGTLATRSHPLGLVCVVQNVVLVGGQLKHIQHTLGENWRYAQILGSQVPGSTSCILVAASNPTLPQDKFASVVPTGTGTYDVAIYPG